MACTRVLQQQGQPQHSRQWGPAGPKCGAPSSGSASSGRDVNSCGYRALTGPGAGTTCWSPDHSASRRYRRLDDLHPAQVETCVSNLVACVVSSQPQTVTSLAPAFVTDSGATSQTAQLSFTLDSGSSRCFFRGCTDLIPLRTPITVALADPSMGPVVVHSTTTLPCPAAPSGFLTGYYTPSFSKNLVGVRHFHDLGVVTTFPLDEHVASCTIGAIGAALAIFHREPGSGLYSLHNGSHHTESGQVRSPASLAPPPRSHAPLCTTCIEGWQRVAPHSLFPTPTAPFQTLHLDIWGLSPVLGPHQERYFLIVVDDYSHYATVFPLRRKADVPTILQPWILARDGAQGLCGLCVYSDHGGEFAPTRLSMFCGAQGIIQSYTLPASPQQNGVAERRIGLVMEVTRSSMCHAGAPHENKLSARTRPCVFLSFPRDTPGWVFYDPLIFEFFSSHDVTFDELGCYYRSRPHQGSEAFPPTLFFTPVTPPSRPVSPPPPSRPALSGVSHVTPQPSPPQSLVPVVSRGAGGPGMEHEGTVAAGAGGAASRGAGFPPRSSLRSVDAEPGGGHAGGTGGTQGVAGGGSGSGGAGSGGPGTLAPTPRAVRFQTREQRLLRLERQERERFERARPQQQQQTQSQSQDRVEEEPQQQVQLQPQQERVEEGV
ncbi:unnamed protein product [Closterium sp. NIES-54]